MSTCILAFDTSGPFLDIALRKDHELFAHTVEVGRGHGEALGPAIEAILGEAGVAASALTAVVVPRGPGSFTGLRIAISFAKGIQAAISVPVYAVDTLRAMIRARYRALDAPATILAVIDGRKHRFYAACEHIDLTGVHRVFGPVDETAEELRQRLRREAIKPDSLVVTGDPVAIDCWSPYSQAHPLDGGVAEALCDLFLENDSLVSVLEEHEGPEYHRVSQAEEPK